MVYRRRILKAIENGRCVLQKTLYDEKYQWTFEEMKMLKKCLDLRRERYLIEPERELKQGNKRIFSFGKDDNEILETKKWSSMNMNVNPTTINTKNMKNIFPNSSTSKKNSVKRLQKNNPYKKLFSIEEEEANSKMNFNEKRKTMNSVFDYRQIEKVPKLNTKEDVSNMNTNAPPKNTTPMNTNAPKPSTSKPSTSKKTVQIK
jgi:hypothetical protein